MTEVTVDFKDTQPAIPPIIKAIGKENASLNGRFPQQAPIIYDIGNTAKMFLELQRTGTSWKDFFASIPPKRLPNPYAAKAYVEGHKDKGIAIHPSPELFEQNLAFTYSDPVEVSYYAQEGLIRFLQASGVNTSALQTTETYLDRRLQDERASRTRILDLDAVDKITGEPVYQNFVTLLREAHDMLHTQEFTILGTLVRDSLGVGYKKLRNNSFNIEAVYSPW